MDCRSSCKTCNNQKPTALNVYNLQQSKKYTFSITHGSCYSSLHHAGVPQGSLLGPTIFNIYINDIPSVENDHNVVISVYADDTNNSVRSGRLHIAIWKISNAIRLLQPWFQKWRIKTNITKCFSHSVFGNIT
jgi:hypothetical protein